MLIFFFIIQKQSVFSDQLSVSRNTMNFWKKNENNATQIVAIKPLIYWLIIVKCVNSAMMPTFRKYANTQHNANRKKSQLLWFLNTSTPVVLKLNTTPSTLAISVAHQQDKPIQSIKQQTPYPNAVFRIPTKTNRMNWLSILFHMSLILDIRCQISVLINRFDNHFLCKYLSIKIREHIFKRL